MNIDQKRVDELLAHPSESLNVEIKNWISPGDKAAEAKIVRASLALQNRNGRYLIIGFHDNANAPIAGRNRFMPHMIRRHAAL